MKKIKVEVEVETTRYTTHHIEIDRDEFDGWRKSSADPTDAELREYLDSFWAPSPIWAQIDDPSTERTVTESDDRTIDSARFL